ncbi:MAG: molybdopterin dinucleotide binding domain-containing protein, partial [Oleiphilaceae bacterium]|nr:molybdopterin dinucleotide binding domain-containing protein [Oleiphilaceae bacterium]
DEAFIAQHCEGFDQVKGALAEVPIDDYILRADVSPQTVRQVAHDFAHANSACVRVDLGIQHTPHSTVSTYLEKLLYLLTGHFGKAGGNNLHSSFLPVLGNSDERKRDLKLTARHKMQPIAGLYPPNILPDEIEHAGEDRLRACWVDSCNPVMSYADTEAYERAFKKLELLVVVDVAMTESARLAHYILPAASQFEKWEATGFNAEFPRNFFHLRKPLFEPLGNSLPEPEIYTRLLEKMGVLPESFPMLKKLARWQPEVSAYQPYLSALMLFLKRNKHLAAFAPSILYRTLGPALPEGARAAALLLPLAIDYANKHGDAVRRAGVQGNRITLGPALFRAILANHSGVIISEHRLDALWRFIKNPDGRVHLAIEEVLQEMRELDSRHPSHQGFPFILMAGERRSYNANQIYRDPAWRKTDKDGAMRLHPEDAARLEVETGDHLLCRSRRGELQVVVSIDDSMRPGVVSLPHGYGMRFKNGEESGPALNRITASNHCDPFTKTPYHKYVPVQLEKITV